MNFLVNRGGRPGGSSDSHSSPLQLGRGRVKLQPRRLRSATAAAAAAAAEPEPADRVTRTHLFFGLAGGGGGGGGGGDGDQRVRRSGLLGWLTRSSRRRTSRSRQEEQAGAEMAAAAAAAAAAAVPPPPEPCEKELLSLEQLSQDCFMVPHELVHRFLPTGHKLPASPPARGQRLRMHETSDPDLSVVLHVQTPLEPVSPPSALDPVSPLKVQLTACLALLKRVTAAGKTRDAILLSNLERTEPFPFLLYYTVQKKGRTAAQEALEEVRQGVRTTFSPLQSTLMAQHTVLLYQEVATIARPPLNDQRRPSTDKTGYIISVFRVMEGDDRHSFERDWPSWTGARLLYRTIPKWAGLRRIVLHKSCGDTGDIYYVLSCECCRLLDDVVSAVKTLPALRARLIGYTGIYKPMAVS